MQGFSTRKYGNISKTTIDMLITEAVSQGGIVTGSNPWNIDTRLHGTVLRVSWDEMNTTMAISVVRANWYIQSETVWVMIDSMLYDFIRQKKDVKGEMDFRLMTD